MKVICRLRIRPKAIIRIHLQKYEWFIHILNIIKQKSDEKEILKIVYSKPISKINSSF